MSEEKVYELQDLVSRLKKEGGYFLDFLRIRNLEAGVILLHPGEKDTQEPHLADELYFIVEGSGLMEIGRTKRAVKRGSVIFIPAKMHHRFYDIKEDILALYMFSE